MKKAVVAGSYDPFTTGHLSIVKQAAELFDEVHVMIFKNSDKKRTYDEEQMIKAIQTTLEKEELSNCKALIGNGLLAQYCYENGIKYNIRGVRNNMDYMYEENMTTGNTIVYADLKTIYFRADGNMISSTIVRELKKYGKDVSAFVPADVYAIM